VINGSFKEKKLVDQKRKCTDVLCCIVFVCFMVSMICFSIVGYMNGEIDKMLAPVDGNGRLCGFSTGVEGYPKLWIANLDKATNSPTDMFDWGVCTKECPESVNSTVSCVDTKNVHNCSTPGNSYGTYDLLDYCLPQYDELTVAQQAGYDAMVLEFSNSFFGSWGADIYKARWVILSSIGIGLVITLIYVVLMRYLAAILAWLSIAFV